MMWRESSPVSGGWRPVVTATVDDMRPQRAHESDERRQPALHATWRADADEGPHQESQVEATDVHEEPFQDVRVAAKMRPPHSTGFIEMGVRSFQSLTAAPLQRQS